MANKKQKNYGTAYMGSKSRIAEWVVGNLPSADTLVDVFCGGCAITHCAALSGKYKRIIANDITGSWQVFKGAINGEYSDKNMNWVSREEFFDKKDSDPFIKTVWSFGNRGLTYLYSREIEPYKKAVFDMLTAPTINERRLLFHKVINELNEYLLKANKQLPVENINGIKNLQYLHPIESVNRMMSCQNNGANIDFCTSDYRELNIPDGAVIYCDPPYMGSGGYGIEFDHEAFWEWCRTAKNPIVISEYNAPDDFVCIGEHPLQVQFKGQAPLLRMEKLFRPKHQL